MTGLAARAGLVRSLAIYRGQPWRRRALRRFYRDLLGTGDLAFDIGAHVGNRSQLLIEQGFRVVAVEPQALFHDYLKRHLPEARATVLKLAVGAESGTAELAVSSRHPTVSTLSEAWREKVAVSDGFAGVTWDRCESVRVTTLDALIADHGLPEFCKIDVEGMEAEILKGLSQPIPLLAVEYLSAAPQVARDCLRELDRLGQYEFNAVAGESHRFVRGDWVGAGDAPAFLDDLLSAGRSGDLYARRTAAHEGTGHVAG
ncbi:methyltransferase, FkbM family [Hartmannibacter diazotrophicus]|uniref:Methyltransferase, FkbM family n=1 Tax=Hartmannibacter diazotrophicus TaxID=1482074 RepID=A0A2C9DBH9_9HYPH|nr:FkbM family methyltransferase [Hartmannibacter diazotrophicus]SON57616.1 methyltransferase, FkbM family [Hartmannibacter diazotrophicus]